MFLYEKGSNVNDMSLERSRVSERETENEMNNLFQKKKSKSGCNTKQMLNV